MKVKPGSEARVDYEFVRHGVVNVFIANEPLLGKRFTQIKETKTKRDWARFIKLIADKYPKAEKISLVMDNLKTHVASALYETFAPKDANRIWDRFEFIYTHGSWLNMAEIELRILNGQCLNRHISTKKEVQVETIAWQNSRNRMKSSINWQFTTKDARIKLKRLYPSINV